MQKIKVLVVDDEPGIRSGVNRILSRFSVDYPFMDEDIGFDIYDAGSAEEALEIMNNTAFEIILLDNKLPGMLGIEVLEIINTEYPDTKVMMITSHASLDVAVTATKNGAFDFVPKPFTPQELKSSIENITKHIFLKKMTANVKDKDKNIRLKFLSILSHELKAPLNAIEGYLNMMNEQSLGNDIIKYNEMIERSLTRVNGMRGLIMDLLDLTKIESGKKNRIISMVSIKDIIEKSIDGFSAQAEERNISLNSNCDASVVYKTDRNDLEIILNNLVSNALKYNNDNGSINIESYFEEDKLLIKVSDTGIGMSEDEIAKLFGEFVRIKNKKTKNITGSGLGLSIVKKLVELNKGQIEVVSEIDKGSVFTIIFTKNE